MSIKQSRSKFARRCSVHRPSNPPMHAFHHHRYLFALCVLVMLILRPDRGFALGIPIALNNPDQVIETLPTALNDAQLRQWRERLEKNPSDEDALLGTGNRYLDLAASTGDERYLGYLAQLLQKSSSKQYSSSEQSAAVLILQARLLQRQHQFDAAATLLESALHINPHDAQAQLLMAYIRMAQGDPQRALSNCAATFQQVPTIATHCMARAQALSGQAQAAHDRLLRLQKILVDPQEQQDVQLTLAEIEQRLGLDDQAEAHLRQILENNPQHLLAQLHLADMYLASQRYQDCWQLLQKSDLQKSNQQPSLLLRKTIAAKMLSLDAGAGLQERLQRYFDIENLRNPHYASRDYAIYLRVLTQRHDEAARVALQNWQRQREPEDAITVLQTAKTDNDQQTATMISQWAQQIKLEDIRIAEVISR
jgi:Tfp pilus assembly protein PilF